MLMVAVGLSHDAAGTCVGAAVTARFDKDTSREASRIGAEKEDASEDKSGNGCNESQAASCPTAGLRMGWLID